MRPQGTSQQLQKRRECAIKLLKAGKKPIVVARALSASRSSVSRWQHTFKRKGLAGLNAKPIPGRPPNLTLKQKQHLERLLLNGPLAVGYKTDLWTLHRIAQLVKRCFHITYHPGHVWKILRALGWSCQKPERRATQRNEAAITRWKRYVWPQIRHRAEQRGAHLVFVDESGFLLIPNVKRTWAPRRFPRSTLWQFHQNGNASHSICNFVGAVSKVQMSNGFCNICSSTCRVPLSCCGTRDAFIAIKKSKRGVKPIHVFR
jgi:transposase